MKNMGYCSGGEGEEDEDPNEEWEWDLGEGCADIIHGGDEEERIRTLMKEVMEEDEWKFNNELGEDELAPLMEQNIQAYLNNQCCEDTIERVKVSWKGQSLKSLKSRD